MRSTRSSRLSIAIGADAVTAVSADGSIVNRVARVDAGESTRTPLAATFATLSRMLSSGTDTTGAMVDVAIMPSLCEVRLVNLPPLKAAEAEAIIRRDVGKHFTVSSEHRVIGVRLPKRGTSSTKSGTAAANPPVMAAAVSQNLLDEISAAALHTGWNVRRIVPAQAAWLNAVAGSGSRGASADASGRARAFIAIDGDTAYIVRIENGSPVDMRRLPASQTAAIAAVPGATTGTVHIFGGEGRGDGQGSAIGAMLSAAGWSVLPVAGGADVAAARNAATADLPLLSASLHASRYAHQRNMSKRLWTAAAILVVMSAAVAHWGANRELTALRQKRAAIHSRVTPLLAIRDSVDRMEARSRETDALFSSQSRWSRTLYEITMLLPTDAHLTRLNATGDTIVIEGEGARAGDVLEAFSRAPSLRGVQLEGPVQRDLADGTTTTERFAIQATLATAAAKPKAKRHVTSPSVKPNADEAAALGRLP